MERTGTTKAGSIVGIDRKVVFTRCCLGDRDRHRHGTGLNLLAGLSCSTSPSAFHTRTLVHVTAAKSLLILLCSQLAKHANVQTQTHMHRWKRV